MDDINKLMQSRIGSPEYVSHNNEGMQNMLNPQAIQGGSAFKKFMAEQSQQVQYVPMTLPTDSNERKEYPLFRGVLKYFPAALAGVAKISKAGNDKHNPGEELHHARGKSPDHADCIIRHLTDTADLLASLERNNGASSKEVLSEVSQLAWRALAFSQELHERFGAPLAPGAKK